MIVKCCQNAKNDLKVHFEMYTCKSQNSSHCCGKVFPSATALRSLKRYKHLKKICKIREKTFKSLYKLKSPKEAIHLGQTNLQ